jgi:hypothetical protein
MFSPPCARTDDLIALWQPSQSDVVLSPLWLMSVLMQTARFSAISLQVMSHAPLRLHNLKANGKSAAPVIIVQCCNSTRLPSHHS